MKIVKEPDKILHRKLKEVKEITPEISELILAMKKQMKDSSGVGLAANQVGEDLQLFVIEPGLAKENGVSDVYVNPEITDWSHDKAPMEEGCLSLPGYWAEIDRSKKVQMKALDENGKKVRFKARGFLARVLQHEYDHLNGILIKDKARK